MEWSLIFNLNLYPLFFDMNQVRQLTYEWIEYCNYRRPYETLDNLTPKEWKIRL